MPNVHRRVSGNGVLVRKSGESGRRKSLAATEPSAHIAPADSLVCAYMRIGRLNGLLSSSHSIRGRFHRATADFFIGTGARTFLLLV